MNRKLLLFSGSGIVLILLYLLAFIFPTLNRINFLKETLPEKEQGLKEMNELSGEYIGMTKEYASKEALSIEAESIFSLVERIAKARGLSDKVSSIKPVISSGKQEGYEEASVEVKMKDLTMQNLVNYLFTLEGPPYNLKIKEIQINSAKDRLSIEVNFIASRWEKRE